MEYTEAPESSPCVKLADLIAVEPEVFFKEYLGSEYLLSRRAELDGFPISILKDEIIASITSGGLRSSSVRLVKEGHDYTGILGNTAPGDSSVAEPYVEPRRISGALAAGYTIVARSVHRYVPPANLLARQLARQLGVPVRITAYITPPGSRGLQWHYDAHDVFIVQLEGSKIWHVAPPQKKWPVVSLAWHRLRAAERETMIGNIQDIEELHLETGDVLYLPRGYLHAPEARKQLSIHMTISVHPVTRFDLAQALIAEAVQSEWWREAISVTSLIQSEEGARDEILDIVARLEQEAQSANATQLIWSARDASREEGVNWPVDFITQAAAIRDVHSFDRYSTLPGLMWHLGASSGETILYTEVGEYRLGTMGGDIAEVILSSPSIAVKDLAGRYDPDLVESLLVALLRSGVIRPVPEGKD